MVILFMLGKQQNLLNEIRTGWDKRATAIISLVGATGGLLLVLLWDTASLENIDLGQTLARFGLSGLSWWFFVVYYVTIHPVLEELYWRGYLFRELPHRTVQDAAFAGYHVLVLLIFLKLPWVLVSFGLLWFSAWCWRRLTERYDGLGVVIASHAVADLSILLAVAYLLRKAAM